MATTTNPVSLQAAAQTLPPSRTLWQDAWVQFRKHKLAMIAMFTLVCITLIILVGPFIWRINPERINITAAYTISSPAHPLGTDHLGRDTLARVIFGGRISLAIGISAMLIAMFIGTLIGLLAGYFRSLDNILMRLTDMFLSLPLLPLLLVITLLFRDSLRTAFGPEAGIFILIMVVIGGLGWMPTARLDRKSVV